MTAQTTSSPTSDADLRVAPQVGHVALRVADLERATAFYRDVIGLEVSAWGPHAGIPLAILTNGDHPLGVVLMAFEQADGMAPPDGHTGLEHLALLFDGPEALAAAAQRLREAGHPIDHASDHEATVSLYLKDTEDNGLELYYQRSRDRWFDAEGRIVMANDPLDVEAVVEGSAG
jgi:catechol 2,3-dioxygenase